MKIFRNESVVSSAPQREGKEGKISRKKAVPPKKKDISDREIREKLAGHVETSNTSKGQAIKNSSKMFGAGFMNENQRPSQVDLVDVQKPEIEISEEKTEKKDHLLKSDIALNDPKDSNTQEKLKTVLSRGAFNFNPKERETLERILGQ